MYKIVRLIYHQTELILTDNPSEPPSIIEEEIYNNEIDFMKALNKYSRMGWHAIMPPTPKETEKYAHLKANFALN